MDLITLLLLIGAALCFGFAAFYRPQPPRVNLLGLGLLLWVLVEVLQAFNDTGVS
jgi:uncharacterized membrane protein YccC